MTWYDTLRIFNRHGKPVSAPTLSLFLFSNDPLSELGPRAADALELYLSEYGGRHLRTKFKQSGQPGEITGKAVKSDLARLRSSGGIPEYRVIYDSDPSAWVGEWGVFFEGVELPVTPDEADRANFMKFDFQPQFGTVENVEATYNALHRLVSLFGPSYGYASYCLKRSEGTLGSTRKQVTALISRYRGLDPCYLPMRFSMRDRSFAAHWIDVIGNDTARSWGISDQLSKLSGPVVTSAKNAHILRNATIPELGDANRPGGSQGSIPTIARLLRPFRTPISGLGSPDFDVQSWLARYDDLQDGPWDNA